MKKTNKKHISLIKEILKFQVAALNTPNEFYCCYTFPVGKFPKWVKKAKKMIKDYENR